MDQEETRTDAPVKPAKPRAPRKSVRSKTPAAAPDGEAGVPAASLSPEKVRKPRAPRRKKETQNEPQSEQPPAVESAAAAAEPPAPAPQETPRPEAAHRKSKPKKNAEAVTPAASAATEPEGNAPVPAPRVELPEIPEPPAEFRKPEPVPGFAMPEVVGGNEGGSSNNRRKRRRNRNRNREDNNRDALQNRNTPSVDPEELYRRAWKIFLGEVTEEGLALMDDRTAAEASRRAFKVAEIFLQEAGRHRPAAEPQAADEGGGTPERARHSHG